MAFYLFTYTMTSDKGFAPAVSDGVFSLACCSSQLRRKIAGLLDGKNEIWFMGLMGKTLARSCKHSCEDFAYAPVYIAKADHVVKASEYFRENGKYAAPHRRDQVYLFDGEHWSVTEKNPHVEYGTPEKDFLYTNSDVFYRLKGSPMSDVILAKEFVYFGKEMFPLKTLDPMFGKLAEYQAQACRSHPDQTKNIDEKEFVAVFKKLLKQNINPENKPCKERDENRKRKNCGCS